MADFEPVFFSYVAVLKSGTQKHLTKQILNTI